jgi:MFS family permease
MSFKLFIYYCALCGAWAAFVGWGLGRLLTGQDTSPLAGDNIKGLFLGLAVALALGVLDAVWNLTGHRYAQVVVRGLFLGALGALAGLAGAAFGHALVSVSSNPLFYILGWTLVGLVIGASVGLYDFLARMAAGDTGGSIRKVMNGLIGGTLGGALGGFLFVFLGQWVTKLFSGSEPPRVSTAIGFVALGACIGLFIGLAQVILKEAWIKVESGRRAGREMILSKDETTIGRAEACDLGLFGDNAIEKMHARIQLKKGRYLLADAGTPGGTYLNDRRIDGPTPLSSGDAIRVGGCVLRFGERQKKKK